MKRALRHALTTAIGAALIPTAAAAQLSTPLGSAIAPRNASYSKSDAILGGPSKLASILALQSASPTVSAPAPAAGGAPVVPAVLSEPRIIADDRPDVFGSVALAVPSTPLDARWHQVEHGAIGARAAAFVDSLSDLTALQRIDAVNRFVNAAIAFTNDNQQFAGDDRWLTAADSLGRGKGDCEDFAIAKLQMLRHAGVAEKDLYLVVLHDTRRQADHAVLVVRADGRLLVLDNGTSQILDSDSIPNYQPIFTFAGDRAWTHGYRRQTAAPVQYAKADTPKIDATTASVAMAAIRLPSAAVGFRF